MTSLSASASSLRRRSFDRILIIKPSSLGDIVHALPVLHGLRKRYPHAQIDWLVASSFSSMLENQPDLNELVVFDRQRFRRVGRSPSVTAAFARFIKELRSRRYDLAIDLQGLFRTGFMAWASGANVRIGLHQVREAAWLFYNHRTAPTEHNTHAVDRYYGVAELLGFDDVPIRFQITIDEPLRLEARTLLDDCGGRNGKGLIGVAPGARWDTKRWPADKFAALIDELHKGNEVRCVLIGGPDDVALCRSISAACRVPPIDLAGRTSLRLLPAVVQQTDLVIGHDSGLMHLAIALDRPVVCLIGPTNPDRTGPYHRPQSIVRLDLPCAPCSFRQVARCPHDHRCMRDLEVASVLSRVDQSLGHVAAESG